MYIFGIFLVIVIGLKLLEDYAMEIEEVEEPMMNDVKKVARKVKKFFKDAWENHKISIG